MKEEPHYYASPVPHYYDEPSPFERFKCFHFGWKHVLSGTAGEGDIWCRNRDNFLELLNYWNRDTRWEYSEQT